MGRLTRNDGGLLTSAYPVAAPPLKAGTITVIGLVSVAVYVVALLAMMASMTYDTWGALLVAPVLVIITVPALRRQAAREADRRLFTLLFGALVLKLLGGVARYMLGFVLYQNKGDAFAYHTDALAVTNGLLSGHVDLRGAVETPETFISFIDGVVYAVFRPSILAGFLVFSWLGFLGLLWFYRAFQMAVPEGRPRTYARLIFFLPSIIFWPSSIGKEAWMLFALGLASLGVAHLLTGRRMRGLLQLGLGLLGATLVRPHYAGIVAIAFAIAYLIKKPATSLGQLAPVVKVASLVVVVAVAALFLQRTEEFLESSGLSVEGGLTSVGAVTSALGEASIQTETGGSEFRTPGLGSPSGIVLSIGTVLFRPLPTEADNAQVLVTALESSALLLLVMLRFRSVVAALRSMRRQPYVAYLCAFVLGGAIALSSVANFGILARQRTLLVPALMIVLSIPRQREGERA